MPKHRNRKSTTHGCPLNGKGKGNCRRSGKICTAHQITCPDHDLTHTIEEECRDCKGEKERAREKAAREAAAREAAAREAAAGEAAARKKAAEKRVAKEAAAEKRKRAANNEEQ